MNNGIKKLIAMLILVAGGAVFIVFGTVSMKEIKNFLPVPAVVSHVQREWVPDGEGGETEDIHIFVTYTVDGKEYTEELQNTKTNLHEDDSITVLYNPEKPHEVSGATKGMATIQFIAGGILILAGLGTFAVSLIKGR